MPFDGPYPNPFGDIELLTEARSRISSRESWVQGRFQGGNRRCLIAALSLVCGSRSVRMPNRTERRLARLIAVQIPPSAPFVVRLRLLPARQRLMSFNDEPHTRHEDVMALFDRTIHSLAAQVPVHILS
jgi:hypothetical protein